MPPPAKAPTGCLASPAPREPVDESASLVNLRIVVDVNRHPAVERKAAPIHWDEDQTLLLHQDPGMNVIRTGLGPFSRAERLEEFFGKSLV